MYGDDFYIVPFFSAAIGAVNLRLLAAYAYAEFDGYGNADILRYGIKVQTPFLIPVHPCLPGITKASPQHLVWVIPALAKGSTVTGTHIVAGCYPTAGQVMFSLMTSISKSSFKVVLFYTMNPDRFALNKLSFVCFSLCINRGVSYNIKKHTKG